MMQQSFCGTNELRYIVYKVKVIKIGNIKNYIIILFGIGVFGGLDLHGADVGPVYWTTLEKTVNPGEDSITLTKAVQWALGSDVMIAPTGYKISETEIRSIKAISANKKILTLGQPLQYKHIGM